MKKPAQLVFIPSPGIGHIVSTAEIAKQLVARHDQLFITILVMNLPYDSKAKRSDHNSLEHSSISKRINFIDLPESHVDTQGAGISFFNTFVENHKTHIKDAVTKLLTEPTQSESRKPRIAGFVVDMFCTTMIDVANEFGVPSYVFYTSSAACLGFLLHLQSLQDEHGKDVSEISDSDAELAVPSFANPLPHGVLPGVMLNKEGTTAFLNQARRFRETKGILVNTFSELELHAIHYLSGGATPLVYPVGPILNLNSDDTDVASDQSKQKTDILKWLDDQPPLSVVFLCFGSMGSFGDAQAKEIARALENSELRFLWSLRQPPPKGTMVMPSDYADLEGVLPEGFLNRTAKVGKVIGWAPQVAILAHPAIGGFVSHCGWNSTLESLWYGVPVATWPLYAEQQLNAFEMVKDLELAVEIKMDFRKDSGDVVSSEDIERGIKKVMEHGSDIRERVKEISEKSKKALMDGGSSYSSLGRFIDQL